MKRNIIIITLLSVLIAALFVVNLIVGAVDIPLKDVIDIVCGQTPERESWRYIVIESRLPQDITAMLCGAALAASGLLLQTAFRNPLAGPSVFGINSGASLGVAIVMLLLGGSVGIGSFSIGGFVAILFAAFVGAMGVMLLILAASSLVRSGVMLLIVGIMIGYIASSAIALLNFFATEQGVQSYMVWGLGNFGGVSLSLLPWFSAVTLAALLLSLLYIKPLNALLLGEQYAENLGFSTTRLRTILLLISGLLTAVTTAFCGPIAFIGLAVPHIARLMLSTDNHQTLLPVTMLTGAAVAMLCNIICVLPGEAGIIPLNAVTPLIGAPVIIYVIATSK